MKKLILTLVALVLLVIVCSAIFFYFRPLSVLAYMSRRSLSKAGFTEQKVNTAVGPQVSLQNGSGPTLVFLHGAGDHAGTWANTAPQFASHYRVVLLDLPGHRGSAPGDGPLKMRTVIDGSYEVLAKLPPPIILVGNSLGGWVAMLYAQHHPDRVQRLVLVDGGATRGNRPDLAKVPADREQARKMWEAVVDPGSPSLPNFVLNDVTRSLQHGPMARLMAAGDMERYLMRESELASFVVPVDLLWGESDQLVNLQYARALESGFPAARLTTLARCGHVPQNECPSAFAAALEKILAQPPPKPRPLAPVKQAATKEKK
jgi:pimeloyl-ACP methyl ester carboxylesterase